MQRRAMVLVALVVAIALVRRQAPEGDLLDQAEAFYEDAVSAATGWTLPDRAAPYASAIASAEEANGIPAGLLARQLYQESRYRDDIITGETASSVGALGIAQFMPATAADLGVNPLDPFAAIAAAARYMRTLYAATGTWAGALAAYNWGVGNVQRKGIEAAPKETRDYVAQILGDVGLA